MAGVYFPTNRAIRPDLRPWTAALLDALGEEGEWMFYQDALDLAMPLVPEEQAFEVAEKYRSYYYSKQGLPLPERKYGEREDTIKTGRKAVVSKAIQDLRRSGRIQVLSEPSDLKRQRILQIRRFF